MRGRSAEPAADPLDGSRTAGERDERDPETAARSICLRLLTDRARTRAELAQALGRRGIPDDVAAAVLDRFSDVGLIDDRAFAEAWVSSRRRTRGLGRRALAAELRHRGVDAASADEAVAQVSDDEERAQARRLVERRAASMATVAYDAKVRRLVAMLVRRGYSGGLAFAVVREVLGAGRRDDGMEGGADLDESMLDGALDAADDGAADDGFEVSRDRDG